MTRGDVIKIDDLACGNVCDCHVQITLVGDDILCGLATGGNGDEITGYFYPDEHRVVKQIPTSMIKVAQYLGRKAS